MPVDTPTPAPSATPPPTASPTPPSTSTPPPAASPTPPPPSTPAPSPTVPAPADGTTFNVRDFGARGDGRADDTAALQAAIDAAAPVRGVVRVPSGSYLTGGLRLPSGVTLRGDGWSSVLLARDNIGDHLISPQEYQTTTVTDVTIRDLKLVGRSAAQNGGGPMPRLTDSKHGIAIIGGQRWTVQRVWAEDFDGDGIYIGRPNILNSPAPADNNLIIDCVVKWNVRNGMMISDGTGNIIRRALFEANQVGMDPSSSKYSPAMYSSAELDLEPNNPGQRVSFNIIEESTFRNGNWNAIQITRPGSGYEERGNIIRNNTFIDNRNVQVYIISEVATANVITGNRFVATSPDRVKMHVRVAMGSDNRIEGNVFQGGTNGRDNARAAQVDSAGKVYWPERTVLRNNVIDLTGGAGDGTEVLIARETRDNIIENNTLINAYLNILAS